MDVAVWLKSYGSAIAWGVAALGWAIGNHQSNRRELRKEVRSEIDDIAEICDKFVGAQKEYFSAGLGSLEADQAAQDVKLHAQAIDLRIRRLQCRRWSFKTLHGTRAYLQDAAEMWEQAFDVGTGGSFESTSRGDSYLAVRTQQMQTRAKALAFIEALHRAFLYEFDQ